MPALIFELPYGVDENSCLRQGIKGIFAGMTEDALLYLFFAIPYRLIFLVRVGRETPRDLQALP
jgi:hypothetical protein